MSEKGLAEHYKVLKQFLVISDDLSTRTKVNSTRAARAREKLLKLSSAQFRELSTDVYDELKRRIDESRGEPDYLLPKSTFHPKRNQARQKLSSLPQSRFKDLVSDISFEIERRDLHLKSPSDINNSNNYASSNSNLLNHAFQDKGGEIDTSNNIDEHNVYISKNDLKEIDEEINSTKRSNSSELLNQTIGVQPKTVIPNKANLTWSSDEENDDDQPEINKLELLVDGDRSGNGGFDHQSNRSLNQKDSHTDQTISDFKDRLATIEFEKIQLQDKYNLLLGDYEYSVSQNKTLSDEMDSLSEEKNNWLENKSDYERQLKALESEATSRSINESKNNDLLLELENLKAANASLRLENNSLKNSSPRDVVSSRETVTSPQKLNVGAKEAPTSASSNAYSDVETMSPQRSNVSSKDIPMNSSKTPNDLKKDMELFFEKLSNLDSASVGNQQKLQLADNDAALWQERYETLRSNQILNSLKKSVLSNNELRVFVTPSGLISMKMVSDLQALIESFMLSISDRKVVPDLLFDKISKISLLGNEIANQGDKQHLNSNENSICLREAVSYALTATRYYAIFSDILPKIVVERSVGEVCFTVCELISVSKLNENSTDARNIYREPMPVLNEEPRNTNETNETDNDINTAVRPLKMTNKLRDYQNQSFSNVEEEFELPSTPAKSPNEGSMLDETPTKNKEFPQEGIGRIGSSAPLKAKVSSPVRRGIIPTEFASRDSPSSSKNLSASPKSRNISALASKFESDSNPSEKTGLPSSYSPSSKEQNDSYLTSHQSKEINSNVTPNKLNTKLTERSNIIDRVKQFDNPTSKSMNNHQSNGNSLPITDVNEQNNILTDNDIDNSLIDQLNEDNNSFLLSRSSLEIRQQNQEDRSDSALSSPLLTNISENDTIHSKTNTGVAAAGAAAAGTAFAGSRSNGLFQSIRNRIAAGSEKNSTVDDKERSYASVDSRELPDAEITTKESANDTGKALTEINKDVDSGSTASDDSPDGRPNTASLHSNGSINTDNQSADSKLVESVTPDVKSDLSITSSKEDNKNGNMSPSYQQELGEKATDMDISNDRNKETIKKPKVVNFLNDINTSNISDQEESASDFESDDDENPQDAQARQRQEYRKSMAAATFNVDLFDIDDPDNTLTQVLLYLEYQTVQVISTIQSLLSAIKKPSATRGDLRQESKAITEVISQMTEATNTSMNQTRNSQLKEHGSWVVKSLDDCNHRMNILCKPNADKNDTDFADKNFKQRLAGISFDIAKCTKELVKTVEEASLKEDIANLDARLSHTDLT